MNGQLLLCIGSGVFVAHMAVFMIYFRVTTTFTSPPPTPAPNFGFAEEVVPDVQNGGRIINREFTISTRLAPPGTYQNRPDRPVND